MRDPLISVIIPAYNAKNTIERAIDSVFNQTYKNFEIIIVNDGSTDETLNIITKLKEKKKENTICIIDKLNGGVSTARNAGMKSAKGQLIAFLDSDDAWYESKLSIQIEIMRENNEVDFLGSILTYTPLKRYLFKKIGYLTKIHNDDLMFKFCFQPSTVLFKKEILDKVGYFDEDQKYAEEGNFFMRIIYNKFGCYLINQKLTFFGMNDKLGFGDGGLSGNLKEMQRGEIKNHKYAVKRLDVSKSIYYSARLFSFLKYVRRVVIVYLR